MALSSHHINLRLPDPTSPQVIFAAMAYAIALENHCGRIWRPQPYRTPDILMFGQTSCYRTAALRVAPPHIGYFEPNKTYTIIEIATANWTRLPCECNQPHKRIGTKAVFDSFLEKMLLTLDLTRRV